MTERRYTGKPHLEPGSVWAMDAEHPAMLGNRTLFPNTVVDVTYEAPERLLVSGMNNRKLGKTVAKGRLSGYALYGLTLEERATCPSACSVRDVCYGNGMPFARRHRVGDLLVFERRLRDEIDEILAENAHGLLVRLHVLGDFPSAAYVRMWTALLDRYPRLACYGYTHWRPARKGGNDIGDAVEAAKLSHPERFRIRWSADEPVPDGAVVIDEVPALSRVPQGLVCPAQTDATACCASCGLCWEPAAAGNVIAFVRHGRASMSKAAQVAMETVEAARRASPEKGLRRITTLQMPSNMRPAKVTGAPPRFENVDPGTLLVEDAYQRDLTQKSVILIRKIVTGWDWSKFKPPVCARTPAGLYVIDGQHTSIGAATHPDIHEIPVMVIPADSVEERARSFVAHNRDRLVMSDLAILKAEVAAGIPRSVSIHDAIVAGGGQVPRVVPARGQAAVGDFIGISAARRVFGAFGPVRLERIVRVAKAAGCRPIDGNVVLGLHYYFLAPGNASIGEASLVEALRALTREGDISSVAALHARTHSLGGRYQGIADLLSRHARRPGHAPPQAPTRVTAAAAALPFGHLRVPQSPREHDRPHAVASPNPGRGNSSLGERFEWTPERLALLGSLAERGLPASAIMSALGPGVTLNAVIGRRYRMRREMGRDGLDDEAEASAHP